MSQFVLFYGETAKWGLLREHKKLVKVLQNISRSRRGIEPLIAAHPYLDGYLAQKAVYANCRRANFLHKMSNVQYGGDKLELSVADNVFREPRRIPALRRFVLAERSECGARAKVSPRSGAVLILGRRLRASLHDATRIPPRERTQADAAAIRSSWTSRRTL
jgi:hypothetical protein